MATRATALKSKLNYRASLLLLDEITDLTVNKQITAEKSVSLNETYFQGHFPDNPVMPGVLLIEAMVEAAQLMWNQPSLTLTKVKRGRFREMVRPGMRITINIIAKDKYRCQAEALISDKKACTAELEFKVAEQK